MIARISRQLMAVRQLIAACLLMVALLLGAAGCGAQITPTPAVPTAAGPSGLTASPTALPATPVPTQAPSATAEAATAAPAPTAEATSAVSPTGETVTLSDHPRQLIWASPGASIPGFSATGPLLLAVGETGITPLHLNPLTAGKLLPLNIPGNVLAVSPTGETVLVNAENNPVKLYDLSGKLLATLDEANPYTASFSPDGSIVTVNSTQTWSIILYDAATGERIKTLTGFETAAPVYFGSLAPGNRTAYWISRATLELQDVQSGEMGVGFRYTDFITGYAFSPDGSRLAISVEDKLYLYSVPDGKELAQLTRSQPANSLTFSPDGKLLAAAYGPGIQFWDGQTLIPLGNLATSTPLSGPMAFSPDGALLALTLENNQVGLYPAQP